MITHAQEPGKDLLQAVNSLRHKNFARIYQKRQICQLQLTVSAIYPVSPRLGLGFAGHVC